MADLFLGGTIGVASQKVSVPSQPAAMTFFAHV